MADLTVWYLSKRAGSVQVKFAETRGACLRAAPLRRFCALEKLPRGGQTPDPCSPAAPQLLSARVGGVFSVASGAGEERK